MYNTQGTRQTFCAYVITLRARGISFFNHFFSALIRRLTAYRTYGRKLKKQDKASTSVLKHHEKSILEGR